MSGNFILLFLVFYPIIGALVSYLIGRKWKTARDYFAQFVAISEFLIILDLMIKYVISMQSGIAEAAEISFSWFFFAGGGLHFALDGFRALYGTIAALMWMMTMLFSKEYFTHYRNRNRYYLFNLLTLGATMGVFLSSNLYTTFIFFEMMSFTSYVWVAHDEKKESLRAAETYLAVAVIGGLVMLMGLFLLQSTIGTLEMSKLLELCRMSTDKTTLYIAGACMLFGFGAKAGAFPLHIWLPKAHPVAPAPASALLSGILTKSGIFGILVVSCNLFLHDEKWGMLILFLGVVTMFGGALLALFSIDLKRTLACSSMSQIGFILVGVGMQCLLGEENALAVRGSLLHMVNHSLIKLALFMAAGVIFMNLHKLDLNAIRGFGRKKPALQFVFLMGALGIGGIPLWNGYISKTLLHESIVEYTHLIAGGSLVGLFKAVEWIFLISGGLTVAYMTKLYISIFVEKNTDATLQEKYDSMGKTYMNVQSRFALIGSAILLPIMGMLPGKVMNTLADMGQGFMHGISPEHEVAYFSWANLKGGLISIVIGVIIYFTVVRLCLMKKETKEYINAWPKWFDMEDKIYRPILLKVLPFVGGVLCRICDSLVDGIVVGLRKTVYRDRKIPQELEEGNALTHAIGVVLDTLVEWKNKVFHTHSKNAVSYVHRLAVFRDQQVENNTIVGRSLSFGLFMFCLGLCLTLIYLLFL